MTWEERHSSMFVTTGWWFSYKAAGEGFWGWKVSLLWVSHPAALHGLCVFLATAVDFRCEQSKHVLNWFTILSGSVCLLSLRNASVVCHEEWRNAFMSCLDVPDNSWLIFHWEWVHVWEWRWERKKIHASGSLWIPVMVPHALIGWNVIY